MDKYYNLIKEALKAREKAYVPYSKFRVGASVLTKEGEIFTGCNIENVSYSATCCAERTAIFKAVSNGKRDFDCIAVVSDLEDIIYPCGVCLQVIMEFKISKIIAGNNNGDYRVLSLGDLLPYTFDKF